MHEILVHRRKGSNFGGLRDLNETQNEVGNTKNVAEVAASEKVTEVKTAGNRGFKSGVKSVGNEKGVASGSAKSDSKNTGKSSFSEKSAEKNNSAGNNVNEQNSLNNTNGGLQNLGKNLKSIKNTVENVKNSRNNNNSDKSASMERAKEVRRILDNPSSTAKDFNHANELMKDQNVQIPGLSRQDIENTIKEKLKKEEQEYIAAVNAEEVKEYNKKEEKLENNRENSEIILKWPVTEEIIASIIDATVKDTKNLINQLINDTNFSNEEKMNKLKEIEREIQEEGEKTKKNNPEFKDLFSKFDDVYNKEGISEKDKNKKIANLMNKNKEKIQKNPENQKIVAGYVGTKEKEKTVGEKRKELKKDLEKANSEEINSKKANLANNIKKNLDFIDISAIKNEVSNIKATSIEQLNNSRSLKNGRQR